MKTYSRAVRQTPKPDTIQLNPPLLMFGMVSKIFKVDNCQQRLVQGQQGGDPSIEFHFAQLSTFGIQE